MSEARQENNCDKWVDLEVGGRIRCLRTSKGVTQAELARAIGISEFRLARIECGMERLGAAPLMRASLFLNVRPAEVMARIGFVPARVN